MRVRALTCLVALSSSCVVYDPSLLDGSRRDAGADQSDSATDQTDVARDAIDVAPADVQQDVEDVIDASADVVDDRGAEDALDEPPSPDSASDVPTDELDASCRCAGGEMCCSGACVSTLSSTTHCGACGNACPNTACVAGSCTNTCLLGFGDCDGNATNGCEANHGTSVNHCGRCGAACSFANARASCAAGVCRMGPCNPGFADCDGNAANGCEVDTNSSLDHCGGCGMRCTIAGMVAACNMGRCEPRGCPVGRGECDGSSMTVCETDTTSSLAHCGRCANPCAIPNSRNACVMSACVSMGCNPGFANCDGNAANGCEVDTNSSVAHCGGCGLLCARPNATTACTGGGGCTIASCAANFGNCDGISANGCETPLTSSTHCGRCGNSCGGSACVSGVCDSQRVVQLTAGASHTCARRNNGTIACWGNGADGRLGYGSTLTRTTPVAVTGITDATGVAAGANHTCARRAAQVSCWGSAATHQLGSGSTVSSSSPVRAGSLGATLDVATGGGHSCIVTGVSSIRVVGCWGDNTSGQVGAGSTATVFPAPMGTSPSFTDWVQVVAGASHACGRRASGAVYCWGNNSAGQLGIGSLTLQRGPVIVPMLPSAVELATGDNHSCARVGGSVYCWGSNSAGQLGDGSITNRLTPVMVPGLTDAAQITAGGNHSCARRLSGAVVCWGSNSDGQLGDGTTTQRPTPTPVMGLSSGVVEVVAGGAHTCARRTDHQVVCWGRNSNGQLGDSTAAPRLTPTLVVSLY